MVGSAQSGNRRGAAIATIVFYSIFGVCLLTAAIVVIIVTIVVYARRVTKANKLPASTKEDAKKKREQLSTAKKTLRLRTSSVILNALAAIFYYFGANITYIIDLYRDELNCGDNCFPNVRFAASILLALALFLFFVTPEILQRFPEMGYDGFTTWFHTIVDVSAVIVELNSIYSEVVIVTNMDQSCASIDHNLSITLIVFTVIIGLLYFSFHYLYTMGTMESPTNASDENCDRFRSWCLTLITIMGLAMWSLVLYLLTDNSQPLGCAFGCDESNMANATAIVAESDNQCNVLQFGIANLILSIFALIFFGCVVLLALFTQKLNVDHYKVE